MTRVPETAISDLVALMYRARWVRLSLAGEVRTRTSDAGSGPWEERGSVRAAPGGRYRAEITDADGDQEVLVCDGAGGPVPFPDLMVPSRLLADFDVRITGRAEHAGRAGFAISGSPRLGGRRPAERVSGIVDAELGILLRYQRVSPAQTDTAEFTSLTVSPPEPADPQLFAPGQPGGDDGSGPLPGGLPASGRSPAQAAPPLADNEVNLLYSSSLGPQRFSAVLREHADITTMLRLARTAAATTEFGRRTRWLWQPSGEHALEDVDRSARLTVAMPGCYRIEAVTDPGPRPALIACDGQRQWRAYSDRVAVRAAKPPPRGIAAIADPAWLLGERYRISVAGSAEVDGRPALHVIAAGDPLPSLSGPLSGTPVLADRVEAFIDRALGICLRQVWSYQGYAVLRTELTDLTTEVDRSAFRFGPPPGMKVITGGLLAEAGQSPATAALSAAKGAAALALEISRRWLNRKNVT